MKKFEKLYLIIIILVIIALIATLCYGYYKKYTMEVKNPIATMEVENFGTIKIELYPEIAPETVANFITLANNGFYDGLTFHRVVSGFMIQGGDPNGDGTGSPTINDLKNDGDETKYSITGEFIANGYKNNTLKHQEGVISMARSDYTSYSSTLTEESYNSAGSQFFIMTADNTSLDGYYAAFGKVIEGLDIVHQIEAVEVQTTDESSESSEASTPVNAPVITSITVETYGVDYGLPQTLEPFDYTSWLYKQYGIDTSSFVTTTEE
jgi:peptidyl-prolyl cis-trans isomerase B (cyclophilin B)